MASLPIPHAVSRPLLAATTEREDLSKVEYPVYCSPKLDGIRTLIHPLHGPCTRKFKPVPNAHIRDALSALDVPGLDGELMVLDQVNFKVLDFNAIQSAVMSRGGTPLWEYWVFDFLNTSIPYGERYQMLETTLRDYLDERSLDMEYQVKIVHQRLVHNEDELLECMATYLSEGYEGLIFRSPLKGYKEGRSTLKQQVLCKYKTFDEDSGVIVGIEPMMHNANVATKDVLGYTERSSHKEHMTALDMCGKLIVVMQDGERLAIGGGKGMDHALRTEIWENKDKYIGRHVEFTYQRHGMLDKPRFPQFSRFREDLD